MVHNLYNDVPNNDQLIYIITLILKQEINNLNNNESCCGVILKELYKKKEVKYFFKIIFFDIFKTFETIYSFKNINLYIDKIIQEIEENKVDNDYICNDKDKLDLIKNEYINKEMNLETIKEILGKCKNNEIKFYFNKLELELTYNSDIYISKHFLDKIEQNKDYSDKILNYYISSFIQITNIIDIFFKNLIDNVDMIPYYIRCICKIIYTLIIKQNKGEKNFEYLEYLNLFFFDVLLNNILEEPSYNTFTNEFITMKNTNHKIHIFQEILSKIFFGELFRKSDYIPLNYYIIKQFPNVVEFQKKLIDIQLPYFIDKLINDDEFSEKYEYDYFKENPEENILYRNICFKMNELCSLITNAEKCKNDINISKKVLEKLRIKVNQQKLELLKSEIETDLSSQENSINNFSEPTKIIKCFMLTDVIINKNGKIQNIMKYEKYNKNYFNIQEIKEAKDDDEITKQKNEIIKIKNLLCGLLFHLEPLSKNNFPHTDLSDILSILKELQKKSIINSNISQYHETIPLNWYINYLLQNLKKINIKSDFQNILNELEEDISLSIKHIPFEDLDIFMQYHERIKKEKSSYEIINNILNDINLNLKVENIIIKECFVNDLNIDLNDLNDSEKKHYEFMLDLINKDNAYNNLYMKQDYYVYYNTIQHFINNFPNIFIFQNSEMDNFKLLKDENIPELINSYFFFIKKNLFSKGIVNESNISDIFNKIYDYIFENLNMKLFPKEQLIEDIKIFQNCYKHQWIELKHLFKEEKHYIIENFLPESINYLRKFEEEKSPSKKMENLNKIFNFLYRIGNFSDDKVEIVDDELSLLTIVVIHSLPLKLFSNYQFCELFYNKNKGDFMDNILSKLFLVCNRLKKDLTEEDFYNISKDEYNNNCRNIINIKLNKFYN